MTVRVCSQAYQVRDGATLDDDYRQCKRGEILLMLDLLVDPVTASTRSFAVIPSLFEER